MGILFRIPATPVITGKGYFGGGNSPGGDEATIDSIQFNTESVITLVATLSVARGGVAGVNSSTRGYFGGGYGNASYQAEIDGIQFDTEAAINPAATLSVGRYALAGVQSGSL